MNLNTTGPLELVARYQSAGAVRRAGRKRIAAYLKKRGVANADALAERDGAVAKGQGAMLCPRKTSPLPSCRRELAGEVLALKGRVDALDRKLERRFYARPEARVLASFPAMGPILGAEFLVAVGDVSPPSAAPTGWRPTRASSRPPATPASGWATTAGCEVATRFSSESSTSRPLPAYAAPRNPGPSTTARGPKARGIPKP